MTTSEPIESLYSDALTEIYFLRAALAHESQIADDLLQFRSLPKAARDLLLVSTVRMAGAARGGVMESYKSFFSSIAAGGISGFKAALLRVGAHQCLTRTQWEDQLKVTMLDNLSDAIADLPDA